MTTATEATTGAPAAAAIMVRLTQIEISPTNPRRRFDPKDLGELTESIRKVGVLQPIVVRPHPKGLDLGYELVAGERRYRAAAEAGLATIPASVRDLSDDDVLEIQVIENLQRADVHPLEEAAAYRRLLATERYSVARIAERIGRSVPYVYDRMRLLEMVEPAQQLFLEEKITAAHAIILSRLKPSDQEKAIAPGSRALFEHEHTLWTPSPGRSAPLVGVGTEDPEDSDGEEFDEEDEGPDFGEPEYGPLKTRTAKELQAWVDEHVRFDPAAEDVPTLFPDTASTLAVAREEAEKIVSITYESYVQPGARDGGRIISPRSWKLADPVRGARLCDHAVTGVIAIGPGRGEAFKVCIEKKKCPIHWGQEMRESAKAAKAGAAGGHEAKMKAQQEAARKRQEREAAERKAFEKALPEILKALSARILAMPTTSPGVLASILGVGKMGKKTEAMVPASKTAESIVRHLAWRQVLLGTDWWWRDKLEKNGKLLGVDVASLVKKHLPAPEKPAKEKKAGKAKAAAPEPKPAKGKKAAAPTRGVCRECGCTEEKACQTPDGPCGWANTRKTLCSACA